MNALFSFLRRVREYLAWRWSWVTHTKDGTPRWLR